MVSTDKVVVVGASGFGRECLDVLEAMGRAGSAIEVVGVVDDGPSPINLERLQARDVPYLGTTDEWLAINGVETRFVLGIGNPEARRRLVSKLEAGGRRPFTAIHPSVQIGSQTESSDGLVICAGVVISTNVRIGRYAHINPNATVGHDSVLQDFISINPAAVISGEVHVGEGTLIGASATVLQGLTLGRGSIVGAGSTITHDTEPLGVYVGSPGRLTKVLLNRSDGTASGEQS